MLIRRIKLWAGRLALPRRLERALPPAALQILAALADAGYEAGLVGGCVRDLLLGYTPKDWDMVTSASVDQILELFPDGRTIGAARATGTVMIAREGEPYEVTPYRGQSLIEDLSRRDFTINAMALGIDTTLHDPLGGQKDLVRRVVRACVDPRARLGEDPVRALRAVRMAAQFDLEIDPRLQEALRWAAPALAGVSPERVGMELGRMLITERPAWAVERLREFGLLAQVAPELLEMVGVEQNVYHAYPVWEHSLLALANTPADLVLRLAALFHDVGKPRTVSTDELGNRHFYQHEAVSAEIAEAVLERLRFDAQTRKRVVHLVRSHMDLHFDGEVSDRAIRRMLRRIGPEQIPDLVQLRRADRLASGKREGELSHDTVALLQRVERLLASDAALGLSDLAVNGDDVVSVFGRTPGPYVGKVLHQLLDEVIEEPERNERERLLSRLAELSTLWYDETEA